MTADEILMDVEEHLEKTVTHYRDGLRGLRTGRATPLPGNPPPLTLFTERWVPALSGDPAEPRDPVDR